MEDKSHIELLRAFAKATNRNIVISEELYPLKGFRATQKFRRMVYMPCNSEKNSFYVWFNDVYSFRYPSSIFSGAFIALPSAIKSAVNIRNRFILDRLDIFSKTRANKIGNYKFDSKAIISGNLGTDLKSLLFQSGLQNQILQALKIKPYIYISINEFKVDFIPELENRSILSIINRHDWVIEEPIIEKSFDRIETINRLIK